MDEWEESSPLAALYMVAAWIVDDGGGLVGNTDGVDRLLVHINPLKPHYHKALLLHCRASRSTVVKVQHITNGL